MSESTDIKPIVVGDSGFEQAEAVVSQDEYETQRWIDNENQKAILLLTDDDEERDELRLVIAMAGYRFILEL